jgi:MTH538 TIR-like domain (DUF1863)
MFDYNGNCYSIVVVSIRPMSVGTRRFVVVTRVAARSIATFDLRNSGSINKNRGVVMSRKIFFSFHYERDAWRAGQVRNSNVVSDEDQYGFIDAVDWESIRKKGSAAIESWIDGQLKNTSVTAVLIGAETAGREWVQYEIAESWNRGNGIVGIRIHNIKDEDQKTDTSGPNPLDGFKREDGTLLSFVCKTYDWVAGDGRKNLGKWAEEAADIRAKYGTTDEVTSLSEAKTAAKATTVSVRSASAPFAPRSPWCADDVERKR